MPDLDLCLPPHLRGPATTITPIGAGLSGAGVYRVDADGQIFVLKISDDDQPLDEWRGKVRIQEQAAAASLSPAVVHVDESRRAVLNLFVANQSLPAFFARSGGREKGIAAVGRTIRRVHSLPLPPAASPGDPRKFLSGLLAGPLDGFVLPDFVADAIRNVLAEEPPARDRAEVMSHNDVNPTNLIFDGERLLLVDWHTAGPNDPFYDLATISVFLCLDADTCLQLLSAYDDQQVTSLPARFTYDQRLVAILCGSMFLHLARQSGHGGATGKESLESTSALGALYPRLQTGSLSLSTAEGQWEFGLALIKASYGVQTTM